MREFTFFGVGVKLGSVCLAGRGVCSPLVSNGRASVLYVGGRLEVEHLAVWCTGERPAVVLRWRGVPLAVFRSHVECPAVASACAGGPS